MRRHRTRLDNFTGGGRDVKNAPVEGDDVEGKAAQGLCKCESVLHVEVHAAAREGAVRLLLEGDDGVARLAALLSRRCERGRGRRGGEKPCTKKTLVMIARYFRPEFPHELVVLRMADPLGEGEQTSRTPWPRTTTRSPSVAGRRAQGGKRDGEVWEIMHAETRDWKNIAGWKRKEGGAPLLVRRKKIGVTFL